MVIRPTDVHDDYMVAFAGVTQAAKLLEVECNCTLQSTWLVKIEDKDRAAFLSLAREEGLKANGRAE